MLKWCWSNLLCRGATVGPGWEATVGPAQLAQRRQRGALPAQVSSYLYAGSFFCIWVLSSRCFLGTSILFCYCTWIFYPPTLIQYKSRIRNKSFGSRFGSGSGLKLVSDPDPVSGPDSNPESNPDSNPDPDLDQKLAEFFFVITFLRSLIFKAALHQLCDLATNKLRKKLAIYDNGDLTHLCILQSSLPHAGEHKVRM
jgi:hypothetical protein